MDNNKKGNILYLVIGVLTLVVAVIGATFAFFSASSTNDEIEGNIAEAGGLQIDVKSITYNPTYTGSTGSSIIPLNLITNQTPILGDDDETVIGYVDANSQFVKAMDRKCKDDLGNNICEVYKITVSNQSATATIQVRGNLNLTSNAENMYWKLINATTGTVSYPAEEDLIEGQTAKDYEVLATASEITGMPAVQQGAELANRYLTVANTADDDAAPVYEGTNISLTGTNGEHSSETFYVVVWLEEIGDEQQDQDASTEGSQKTYQGVITFDAVDAAGNKSGVTATFLS